MAKIARFEDLEIWKEAVRIGVKIYKMAEMGRLKQDFSAKDQLKRAAISMSNNIAEGFEYNNNKNFQRYLTYAKGSAGELRSELFFLMKADLISLNDYEPLASELTSLSKGIGALKKYLSEYEANKSKKHVLPTRNP